MSQSQQEARISQRAKTQKGNVIEPNNRARNLPTLSKNAKTQSKPKRSAEKIPKCKHDNKGTTDPVSTPSVLGAKPVIAKRLVSKRKSQNFSNDRAVVALETIAKSQTQILQTLVGMQTSQDDIQKELKQNRMAVTFSCDQLIEAINLRSEEALVIIKSLLEARMGRDPSSDAISGDKPLHEVS